MPALLMRIVTRPKELIAVCMTAAPSVADEVFAIALPPAGHTSYYQSGDRIHRPRRTSLDLFDNPLSRLGIEVVHNHISTTRGKEE